MDSPDGGSFGDLPTRPMKVKLLYTFDIEARTQCLARLPETFNIPVVPIDEQSQVGVIELQQCIQAIVAASPEILSKLEHGDFTVYNFDYTELDTPIVGQGRMSSLLAPNPSGQDKAMITGRVCKNIQALFSNGPKEILEVKFKLTPLSKPAYNEYARNLDAKGSMSPATSAGFDPNAWSASMNQNRGQQQSNDYFQFDAFTQGGDNNTAMLEQMFGLESGSNGDTSGSQQPGGVGMSQTPTDSAFDYNPAFTAHSHSAPGSRAGSPVTRPASSIHNDQLRHQSFSGHPTNFADQSRPGSRASVRSESNTSRRSYQPPTQNYQQPEQQQVEVQHNEDGQPRKRAKVTQTNWRGKSAITSKSSDLRVTAATASSMHMYRPIAKRPTAPGADLDPPPRVPTPVPQRTILPRPSRQQSAGARSALRQSTVESDFMSDAEPMSDVMTSPEESSPGNSITEGTPMDIPSSPPLVPGFNLPAPSSPGLPTLPTSKIGDSGYMSGGIVESMEDDENRSPNAEDIEIAAQYRSRKHPQEPFVKIEGSVPGDTSAYPMDATPSDFNFEHNGPGQDGYLGQSQGARSRQGLSRQRSTTAASPTETEMFQSEPPTSRRGSLALPKPPPRPHTQQQPPKRPRQTLQRSETAQYSDFGSPAPSDTESRAGLPANMRRAKLIEQRLAEAIARGEMPQYCGHCGAIETPTWRKLYVKTVEGKPSPLDSHEGEGETIAIQALETDEDTGEITKFLMRKTTKLTKAGPGKGFVEMTVCNPCGLWFNKYRNMRPEDKWHRKSQPRKKRKKADGGLPTDGIEPQSEAFFTDQIGPEDALDERQSAEEAQAEAGAALGGLPVVSKRPRANSMQAQLSRRSSEDDPATSRQNAVMRRETQSSPVPFNGSQQSPIELDLTPAKPTRRLLFPSPRQDGEVKSLESQQGRHSASPSASTGGEKPPTPDIVATEGEIEVNVYKAFTSDKENLAPPLDDEDDLSHLFEGSPSALFKTPLRKTPSKRTPKMSQGHFNDILKTPTTASRKRDALTPNQNAANNADLHANDFMTSPSSRYFLRSTPSRLERTPGGRSSSGGNHGIGVEPSPFSRHLAQMLNEANGPGEVVFTSPSRQFDFSDLPTFTTPGREVDWKGLDEILSSEFANYDDNNGMGIGSEKAGGGHE